jgi:Arc/MetJ-type ribon-helix-helix transcriptional regulator
MTIHVSKDVENAINAAVQSGRFASADEMITKLVREDAQRTQQEQRAGLDAAGAAHKPIWEEIQEISARVPDEVWDALPTDLSAEHDHYIYGTPKRNQT